VVPAGSRVGCRYAAPVSVDISTSRAAEVGGLPVRRALPRRERRTVGAWCFVDHFGPVDAERSDAMQVGPHPHIGLQTVTWLLEGEVLHTDSLGTEQPIRPGQLNLMTAGHGIAHAEEGQPSRGCHGIQLWVAQPESTRHGAPAFEHHEELPQVALEGATATVLVGTLAGAVSPARHDTPLVGADLSLRAGTTAVPLDPAWEHALVVADGTAEVDGTTVKPGELAYLEPGRSELGLHAVDDSRVLLIGGEPFGETVLMWWNFVGRTREEIDAARADWNAHDARFGDVGTSLGRITAPGTPWPEPTIL
jgi:redox-sensitive bicupin YhaK (pirin superfamily)